MITTRQTDATQSRLTRLSSATISFVRLSSVAAGLALTLASSAAHAQTVHFGGVQSVSNINYVSYGGILVDPAGNLFVADDQNRQVVEYSAGRVVNLSLGGGEPEYMAVDKAKNLYVATTAPAQVVKFTLSNGVYGAAKVIAGAFQTPWGIAVDSTGNVFVADHAANMIYKLAPSGTTYLKTTFLAPGTLSAPVQMAIDANNNLYVADRNNNRIVKVSPSGAVTTPFASVPTPNGVAVDINGNVAVTNYLGLTYEQPSQGTYKATLVASTFTTPYGVAFDANGNMYVDDDGAQQVVVQTPMSSSVSLPSAPIVNWSATQQLAFVFDKSASLGSSQPYVLVDGGVNSSFWVEPTSTCAANQNFLAGQTCLVNISFKSGWVGSVAGTLILPGYGNTILAKEVVLGTATPYVSAGCGNPTTGAPRAQLVCL